MGIVLNNIQITGSQNSKTAVIVTKNEARRDSFTLTWQYETTSCDLLNKLLVQNQ